MNSFTVVASALLIAGCGASAGPTAAQPPIETLPAPVSPVQVSVPDDEIQAVLAELGEQGVEEFGGIECATEIAHIGIASERYRARVGTGPETIDDLAGDLGVELVLWSFDMDLDQIVPSAGSPCTDFFGPTGSVGGPPACVITKRTLETAVEAIYAQTGELPADQQRLVDDGMIRELADDFEVIDGEVIVAPGSQCERSIEAYEVYEDRAAAEAMAPLDDPAGCGVERRTFETAVEAYFVQFGELPATEAELVESEMLRSESADFDLAADSSVVAASGSICE